MQRAKSAGCSRLIEDCFSQGNAGDDVRPVGGEPADEHFRGVFRYATSRSLQAAR
jgi:hypothetical protein